MFRKLPGIIFLLAFGLVCINSKAQVTGFGTEPNILPPDVAALGKFGSYPVSYYTGTVNVTIPLYDFVDRDASVNLALQYDGSGFVPNKEPGTVGLNWTLMAGGVITRMVNWAPDDRFRPDLGGEDDMSADTGFIFGINSGIAPYSKEGIRSLSFLEFTNQAYPIVHLPFENCPDVFSFNFGDYQGQFFMGNDGKIKVVCDKPLRVDVSQMNGQYDLIDYQNSTISITTDKGDVYTFGGEFNTVDINFPYGVINTSTITLDGKNATITAWHLKQIKTHNGNIINFEYTPQDRIDDFPSPANRYDISPSVDYGYEKLYLHEEISFYHSDNLDEPGPPAHQVFHSFIKKTYLSKITGPAGSVEFTYSHQLHPFYTAGDYVINLNVPNKLDRLTIKDPEGITVKTINLNYNDFGSPTVGYREMLTSVQTIGGQDTATYSMDYYRTSEFPDPLTKGIDIWGFYNGRNQNTALVPASTNGYPYYTVDWSSPNNYRLADTNYCNVGLLHHIVYPTKGTTEFVYEGNSYSKILRKTVAGGTVPETFVENGYAGGARIKKIIDSTGVREFINRL